MTPYMHAVSSAKKFGGHWKDYIRIHDWFDETKQYTGDWTHRALRHHSAGIQWAIALFGDAILNSSGEYVAVKMIGEQHVTEDCGYIPTVQDWLKCLSKSPDRWMLSVKTKSTQTLKEV